jgi:hypothetical protein
MSCRKTSAQFGSRRTVIEENLEKEMIETGEDALQGGWFDQTLVNECAERSIAVEVGREWTPSEDEASLEHPYS